MHDGLVRWNWKCILLYIAKKPIRSYVTGHLIKTAHKSIAYIQSTVHLFYKYIYLIIITFKTALYMGKNVPDLEQ